MTADFLVIGAGIAGLSFALRAARHGSVIVLTKGDAYESNTAWAQGGIASVLPEGQRDDGDSEESHVADTLDAGAGLCKESAVRTIVQEGAAAIEDLTDYGVSFDRTNEHFCSARKAGTRHRRILHAKDTTGREVARALIETARKTPNLTLLEDHFVIDLITSGKLGAVAEDRVLGAYVLERKTGEVKVFRSDRVILAAGGCGKVYLYTTNPDSATGDGVALGWRAGASIANMEFIQFHPTCFYNPGATGPEARSFLVSEAVRGEGGILINAKGEDFTKKIDPRGSLAPRDIVARAIDRELKRTGAACVYLDVTHKPKGFMRERFPYIYQTLMKFGLDCETQPIPVVPAAHYQCGGVLTDVNGKTTIRGLFAVGEVGCTGLHGANRLASNSLLEGNVVARRALDEMMRLYPPGKEILNPPRYPRVGAWRYRGAGRTGRHLSQLGRDPPLDVGLCFHRPHRQPAAPCRRAIEEPQEGSEGILLGPPREPGHPRTPQSGLRGQPDRRVRPAPQGVPRAPLYSRSSEYRGKLPHGYRAAEILKNRGRHYFGRPLEMVSHRCLKAGLA